ncbi:hypothetical protein GDO86_011075, partial [Hymenochirus boettgeri]
MVELQFTSSAMNSKADEKLLHSARNGKLEDVQILLENIKEGLTDAGANVNLQNDMGDTPLHRAAFTGRKEVVMLLLEYNADTTVINGEGLTAKDVTHHKEVKTMLEAVQRTQERKLEEMLLGAAREGNLATLSELLSRPKPPDINCTDQMGNTPLHCASYRGLKHCALKLLKNGADVNIKNKNNQKPIDLSQRKEIRQILLAKCGKHITGTLQRFEGPLYKSSRFFGWKPFWVVLEHGVISWYQKQADAINNIYRQGCKHLTQAICTTHTNIFLKDWLTAIEEHSAYSTHYCSQDQTSDDDEEDELILSEDLKESVENAHSYVQKLKDEVSMFVDGLKNWESLKDFDPVLLKQLEKICDASQETYTALNNSFLLFTKHETTRNSKLEHEQEKNKILSEALQTLATEHHELEQSLVKGTPPLHSILSEDEFYDAVSDSDSNHSLSGFETVTSSPEGSLDLSYTQQVNMSEEKMPGGGGSTANGVKKHRTSLPSPMFSRNDFSIWSILRKCIGMELSKITMPVIFNEPLSFLQRLSEYMEHTYLIHKANLCTDTVERMQCVAAFAVSAVASQWERTGKPFNPLLGETYELVREDLGFRLISEQVSHHPPVSAFHAEGINKDFVFHGSIYPKLKFWGKSVEAEPKGIITLELLKHNEAYTWTNPTCCVHNIIVGKLWIEQYGNMEITNHKTGEKCILNFKPCGLFGKELHKVEGYIQDKSKRKLCALYGKWTECLYTTDPASLETFKKNDKKNVEEKKLSKQMYNFTLFALALNELDKGMESVVPKTDCRLRPDIRAMENGEIDLASEEKKRLEEKQRAARKNRSKSDEEWKT